MKRREMHVVHKATGETALGVKAPSGCVLVQFDRFEHPQSHGWHLYPRRAFRAFVRRSMRKRITIPVNPYPKLTGIRWVSEAPILSEKARIALMDRCPSPDDEIIDAVFFSGRSK